MRFGTEKGRYELDPLPGNGDVVVSHAVMIFPQHRGKGFGRQQHKQRLKKAKELGYKYIVCTVRADNTREILMLNKNGWGLLSSFYGASNEIVHVYGRTL